MIQEVPTADSRGTTGSVLKSSDHEAKRRGVVRLLEMHNLDGMLLRQQSNFAWYTGGARSYVNLATEESIAEILITRTEEHLFVNSIEHTRLAKEELAHPFTREHVYSWWDDAERRNMIERVCNGRVADDSGPLKQEISRLRYSLLPGEIERYQNLGNDIATALWDLAPRIRPGMTEFDLAAEFASQLTRRDIQPLVLLVGFDERIRMFRHPLPSNKRLKSLAMVSVSGRRSGLFASASRLYLSGSGPEDLMERHAAVTQVDAWLLRHTAPGVNVAELFDGLKQQYARTGYPDEWQMHHQGGATGYAARDYRATSTSAEVVQPNQAFAWNPTITGTKSEDTILVRANGVTVLTHDPRWPTISHEIDGRSIQRPSILKLD
jgi:Xaa-Pro aminopeptidase